VIEAAGLDKDKDMTRERLGVSNRVNAIKDRKIVRLLLAAGCGDRGGSPTLPTRPR